MTPNKIQDARNALDYTESRFLRVRGWESTCDNPACIWLWQKALPDGRIVLVGQQTAVSMQTSADAISRSAWPNPAQSQKGSG